MSLEKIKDAGIVGLGGAGFPTHIKLNAKADIVIGNGIECEPLLHVDQHVMATRARQVVDGIRIARDLVGATRAVICLKKKYQDAIVALRREIGSDVTLHLLPSYYPAGDERQLVYQVTGKVVGTGGIPLDVGAVVCNVSTLAAVSNAVRHGTKLTQKHVTVGGDVKRPTTFLAAVGTPVAALIAAAGGVWDESHAVILGGPLMGKLCDDRAAVVEKTLGGVIVLPRDHPLILKKTDRGQDKPMAMAACCQCSMCTQMCPRNAMGLQVQPHLAMRAAFTGNGALVRDANSLFSCCDCGICTYYACNFELSPSRVMQKMKADLSAAGVKPQKTAPGAPHPNLDTLLLPTARLTARLGLDRYDVPCAVDETTFCEVTP